MSLLAKFALFSIVGFVLACGTALLFSARPTPLLGYNADALTHSIGKGEGSKQGCRELDGDWLCTVNGDKGDVTYRLDTRWDGCWEAERIRGPVDNFTPQSLSGCVDIWDHLRLENTFN